MPPSIPGALRWNLSRAGDEFGCHRDTLRKSLLSAGELPGEDGHYSTRQVLNALYGDSRKHETRRAQAEADLAELKRDRQAGKLFDRADVEAAWIEAMTDLVDAVESLDLSREHRAKIRNALAEVGSKGHEQTQSKESRTPGIDEAL